MGTIQNASPNAVWRHRLVPARYGNANFHVEEQSRESGRRVVLHEYPKRDKPYAEDMGRIARRYQMTGYLIAPNYNVAKDILIAQLENSEGAELVDPYRPRDTPLMCICENYRVIETRERGGFCTFEMRFVEIGTPGNPGATNSGVQLAQQATNGNQQGANDLNNAAQQAVQNPNAKVDIGTPVVTGGG